MKTENDKLQELLEWTKQQYILMEDKDLKPSEVLNYRNITDKIKSLMSEPQPESKSVPASAWKKGDLVQYKMDALSEGPDVYVYQVSIGIDDTIDREHWRNLSAELRVMQEDIFYLRNFIDGSNVENYSLKKQNERLKNELEQAKALKVEEIINNTDDHNVMGLAGSSSSKIERLIENRLPLKEPVFYKNLDEAPEGEEILLLIDCIVNDVKTLQRVLAIKEEGEFYYYQISCKACGHVVQKYHLSRYVDVRELPERCPDCHDVKLKGGNIPFCFTGWDTRYGIYAKLPKPKFNLLKPSTWFHKYEFQEFIPPEKFKPSSETPEPIPQKK